MTARSRPARGFSLIELLITLTILGILATVALPVAQIEVQRTREQDLRRALNEIRAAIDEYKRMYDQGAIERTTGASGYPPSLDILVSGVPDARDPNKHKIYFLRQLPRDPLNRDMSVNAKDTWAKRSYASEADDPHEGADVYDVHSTSKDIGLNGQPYTRW